MLGRFGGGFLAHPEEVHLWSISQSISSKMTLISMINYIRQTKVSNRYTNFLGTSSTQIVFTNTLLTHLLDVLNN